jgi:hypothetical protein
MIPTLLCFCMLSLRLCAAQFAALPAGSNKYIPSVSGSSDVYIGTNPAGVSISDDGNTMIVGGSGDGPSNTGVAWYAHTHTR